MNEDFPNQFFPPVPPTSQESERQRGLRTLTHVLYCLYAVCWLTGGLSALVAVIINYVKRSDVLGTPYQPHFEWQIRTFWRSLILHILGGALIFIGIGFVIWGAASIWVLYRVIKGWLYLYDNKTLDSRAWF